MSALPMEAADPRLLAAPGFRSYQRQPALATSPAPPAQCGEEIARLVVADQFLLPWVCDCFCHSGFFAAWNPGNLCIRCGHSLDCV
jgi:hypothetical protein